MSLYALIKGTGSSGYGYGTTAEQVSAGIDLTGKTVLLTGSNAGLGRETLRVLALRGAHIIAAARTEQKAGAACEGIAMDATPVACELSDPASVRACVKRVRQLGRPLDVILCNAGIMALPRLEQRLGYELQFFTNHIGHFILVTELLEQLAEGGRVVMLSSGAHQGAPAEGVQLDNLSGERGYKPWRAYGQSKLANLLFARELARRLAGTTKTANALHPGVIKTNLSRHMNPLLNFAFGLAGPLVLKTVEQGAATQCYVATHPQLEGVSGKYFADCNQVRSSALGENMELAQRLWDASERIVAEIDGK